MKKETKAKRQTEEEEEGDEEEGEDEEIYFEGKRQKDSEEKHHREIDEEKKPVSQNASKDREDIDQKEMEIEIDKKADEKEKEDEEVIFIKGKAPVLEESKTNKRSKSDGPPKIKKKVKRDAADPEKSTRHILVPNPKQIKKETNENEEEVKESGKKVEMRKKSGYHLEALCYRIEKMNVMTKDLSWILYSVKQGIIMLKYDSPVKIDQEDLDALNCYRAPVPDGEKSLQLSDLDSKKLVKKYDMKIHWVCKAEQDKKSRAEAAEEARRKKQASNEQVQAEQETTPLTLTNPIYTIPGSEHTFPQVPGHVPILPRNAVPSQTFYPAQTTKGKDGLGPECKEMVKLITTELYTCELLHLYFYLRKDDASIVILGDNYMKLKELEDLTTKNFKSFDHFTNRLEHKRELIRQQLESKDRIKDPSIDPRLHLKREEDFTLVEDMVKIEHIPKMKKKKDNLMEITDKKDEVVIIDEDNEAGAEDKNPNADSEDKEGGNVESESNK